MGGPDISLPLAAEVGNYMMLRFEIFAELPLFVNLNGLLAHQGLICYILIVQFC